MELERIQYKALEAIQYDKFEDNTILYIEFACDLIDNGIETENIFILAGLQDDPDYEIEYYFNTVITEFDIKIEKPDESFELFLEIHKADLPEDIYNSYYCKSCLKRIQPVKKQRLSLFPQKRYMQLLCPLCGSKKLASFHTNEGKEIYLEQLKKDKID